jgi:SAM-dependent methyltransferase
VDHPWFNRVYPWTEPALERIVGSARRVQNRQACGRTLIIGAGTGRDVPALGPRVHEVVLLEPDRLMRDTLQRRFPALPVMGHPAEAMPFPDEAWDTVLSTLVLCSVHDVRQVLAEVFRVLRPGGQYLFLDHVGSAVPLWRTVQGGLEPVWRRVGGGCHLTRDIEAAVRASPLHLDRWETVRRGGLLPVIRGRAIKPTP